MWRWLFFLIALCIAVIGVVWMVQNPGDVTLQWRNWRLDTSVGVLAFVMLFLATVAALFYRFWRFLRRAPANIGAAMQSRRQNKGYQALSSGMVALAAGDASEARRSARRAESLLSDKMPLTRLLSAQSAQLDGDETAATKFFTEMLEDPDTKFLGVRGLLTQAVKNGDRKRALQLAQDAYRLQSKSEWVSTTLFELQTGTGMWSEAARITDDMARNRLIEKPEDARRRAFFAYQMARDDVANGKRPEALNHLRKAVDLAGDLIPAVVALMRRNVADGQHRKAASLGEKTWALFPHPDLVEPYWEAKKATDGLARMKVSERLAATNKDHSESHITLARAALGAKLWGEARKHLQDAGAGEGLEPPARICRMMADLEEQENGDLTKAREWLVRAAGAPADPKWVCSECGNAVVIWTAQCGNCGAFDGYAWGTPPHKSAMPAMLGNEDDARTPSVALAGPATGPDAGHASSALTERS